MKLTDQDPMPSGKHEGTPMGQVPAEYLDWLDGQDWFRYSQSPKWRAVRQYINENRDAIQAEIPDDD